MEFSEVPSQGSEAGEIPALPSGLPALSGIAAYFRIAADPAYLHRELALPEGEAQPEAILRAARLVGLKARLIEKLTAARLSTLPTPCILRLRDGGYVVFGGVNKESQARIVDPLTRADRILPLDELMVEIEPIAILVARRLGGAEVAPETFGFKWFWPSIWRYRKPIAHVLLASLVVQIFALVTPIFFQVVIDKVLARSCRSGQGVGAIFIPRG